MKISEHTTDRDLVILLRGGNEKAFKQLFLKYNEKLYRYAHKITRSEVISEEIVQDVFLKIWNYKERLKEDHEFSHFLFKVARNHILNILREKKKAIQIEESQDEYKYFHDLENSAMNKLIAEDYQKIYYQVIAGLPPKTQHVFFKSRNEGLSHDEIAKELNISKNTVKVHIVRSLKALKMHFSAHPDFDFKIF